MAFQAIPNVAAGPSYPSAAGSPSTYTPLFKAIPNIGLQVAQTYKPTIPDYIPYTPPKTSGGGGFGAGVTRLLHAETGDPYWMDVLNVLNSIGGSISTQVKDWTDGKMDKKDIPFYSIWNNGVKGFNEGGGWKGFSMTTNPAFNFMRGVGKYAPGYAEVLDQLGVKNPYVKGIGGFIGDVALDPTTYITFGAGSAIKAGTKGAQTAAKAAAKEVGIKAGKNAVQTVPQQAAAKVFDDLVKQGIAPDAAKMVSDQTLSRITKQIQDAGSLSRSNAQNALLNIDVPFTNVTYQFGKKPASLAKSSVTIKSSGANILQKQLNAAGLTGEQGNAFVKAAVGKTKLEDVTFQEYKYLQDEMARYKKHADANPMTAPFAQAAGAAPTADPFTTFQHGLNGGFVPEMGGISPLGQRVQDMFSMFNPRAVGNRNSGGIVNAQGDLIQNTYAQVRNGSNKVATLNKELQTIIGKKPFDEYERQSIEYLLEGTKTIDQLRNETKGLDKSVFDIDRIEKTVDFLRKSYAEAAAAEKGVGALDKTMVNYAPHIYNLPDDKVESILQKYADDPELQQLSKVSAQNVHNQSRTSFKTFAELDNYLAKLSNKMAEVADDPEQYNVLLEKYNDVADLFERDPLKAFQKRMYKSYKVQALGRMYGEMKQDGIILDAGTKLNDAESPLYVKLDDREARKLNVAPGTFMQKDVKKALLEADKLFNNEGLNKFVDNAVSITNIWKGLTTTLRPVHHINNLLGNIFNNGLAGVNPKDYTQATATLNRMWKGKPKQEDLDLMRAAMDAGVFGQAHSDDFRRLFGNQKASGLRKAEKMITDNRYASFMRRWMGDSVDNWSRLAHFISVKNRTGSDRLAADSVRKYLFNYGEQTSADRATRLVIPFWTWTKNNIPLQVSQMLKQPRYYQTYLKLQDASYEGNNIDKDKQASFITDSYFGTPWHLLNKVPGLKGIAPEGPTLRNPRAPVTDLNNFNSPDEAVKFAASSLSPFLRIPFVELPQNRQVFTGKTIDTQYAQTGKHDWGQMAKYGVGQVALGNDLYNLFGGKSSVWDILFGKELKPNP